MTSSARYVGLAFAGLGAWILGSNLIEISYSGRTLILILGSAALGIVGGLAYFLSFDGPARLRTRSVRFVGWLGMLVLALLPWSFWLLMSALVLLAMPTLFQTTTPEAS